MKNVKCKMKWMNEIIITTKLTITEDGTIQRDTPKKKNGIKEEAFESKW